MTAKELKHLVSIYQGVFPFVCEDSLISEETGGFLVDRVYLTNVSQREGCPPLSQSAEMSLSDEQTIKSRPRFSNFGSGEAAIQDRVTREWERY